jgi:pseudouridine-5'-phosphate glycosidase
MAFQVLPDVARALARRQGVVALESTLICHGLPRPHNAAVAVALEEAVRNQGAVPATVAVIEGRVNVGLSAPMLKRLADAPEVAKCTTCDLPYVLATGGPGATTVAATVFVANHVGIKVMATGGLGGVHLGGEVSMDVSADLDELARRQIVVVCSGVKSILDQSRTLERLETLGVPLIGYRCSELPGFYTAASGLGVRAIDDVEALCRLIRVHATLGLPGAIVVVQPPPPEHAMAKPAVDDLVAGARAAADEARIAGPAQTPFMLAHMAERSQGATVRVNRALAIANAGLAGEIARMLALPRAETA